MNRRNFIAGLLASANATFRKKVEVAVEKLIDKQSAIDV